MHLGSARRLRERGSARRKEPKDPMKLLVAMKKTTPKTPVSGDMEAEIARLMRQNQSLRRAVARLEVYRAMAYRDPLTGLWNRRYFDERLKEEFSRSRRAGA